MIGLSFLGFRAYVRLSIHRLPHPELLIFVLEDWNLHRYYSALEHSMKNIFIHLFVMVILLSVVIFVILVKKLQKKITRLL